MISADFPGAVRQALRAAGPDDLPCAFVQGFCGDIRPMMARTTETSFLTRVGAAVRMARTGPSFDVPTADDWARWSTTLADAVVQIAKQQGRRLNSPSTIRAGLAQLPLAAIFSGSTPNKPLTTQVIQFGQALELIAISAEVCLDWSRREKRAAA